MFSKKKVHKCSFGRYCRERKRKIRVTLHACMQNDEVLSGFAKLGINFGVEVVKFYPRSITAKTQDIVIEGGVLTLDILESRLKEYEK